jgi:hypothetical protein
MLNDSQADGNQVMGKHELARFADRAVELKSISAVVSVGVIE